MKWKTDEIMNLAENAIASLRSRMPSLPHPDSYEVVEPGGDHDTSSIRILFADGNEGGEWISIYGFATSNSLDAWDEVDVEMLALETSPGYSGGGIQSDMLDLCLSAQAIKAELKAHGWEVVDSMDRYF